jgi:hypothetical protein
MQSSRCIAICDFNRKSFEISEGFFQTYRYTHEDHSCARSFIVCFQIKLSENTVYLHTVPVYEQYLFKYISWEICWGAKSL